MNKAKLTTAIFLLNMLAGFAYCQNSLTEELLKEDPQALVAEVLDVGDPELGAIAFYEPTMNCVKCHQSIQGRQLGPDLAEKRDVKTTHLIESILNPSAQIKKGYETIVVLTIDGEVITGIKAGETDEHFLIDRIEEPGKPRKVLKEEVEDWKPAKKSTMPESLANQLKSRKQFLDLIAYLNLIAAEGPGRALELKPASAFATEVPLPPYESDIDHAGMIRGWNNISFNRGEEIYQLRCASCHGTLEAEGSMPTSLRFASGRFKQGSDPHSMYRTLTHGYGMMNAQRWMVPQQKYDVIYYIRKKFIEPHNPSQLFKVTEDYLAGLPSGTGKGPKPATGTPWTKMDYGPSWFNTTEVEQGNIAQKGITIRLDAGPGGVESGKHWIMYEHDTMNVAAGWSESFVDFHGIHFDGRHGSHPSIVGSVNFKNGVGPGWANPTDRSFEDVRLVGRDNKRYGPLPRNWAQYQGMYRFGDKSILSYTVGETEILETPGLKFAGQQPVFTRNLQIGPRDGELVLQVATVDESLQRKQDGQNSLVLLPNIDGNESEPTSTASLLGGNSYLQATNVNLDLNRDFSIFATIKTESDGTILSLTRDEDEWMPGGRTLFIRNGRPTFDIGWVGAVNANKRIDDGEWHSVLMAWSAKNRSVSFNIDGRESGGGEFEFNRKLKGELVIRIGFTNPDFPETSYLEGEIKEVALFQDSLDEQERQKKLDNWKAGTHLAYWARNTQTGAVENQPKEIKTEIRTLGRSKSASLGLIAKIKSSNDAARIRLSGNRIQVSIPPSKETTNLMIAVGNAADEKSADEIAKAVGGFELAGSLERLTRGGPANFPEVLTTKTQVGSDEGPFAVDVFVRPTENPWNCRMRLTGVDFVPGTDDAVVCTWDGSVFRVSGLSQKELRWRRVAAGLFQPLGIKWFQGKVYVTCRDQLCRLHDLNDDGEYDYYEAFNSDHQVTEHFHEFAMGLQVDDDGNFYYAKSARHALTAIVPHHGTLLKVSPDGETTEIIANGFRAANGVCLNPDGSFVVTDQEGHWNPKNRINWVREGGFYGNMFGYHDVTDDSDDAMDQPLCWITNSFDRSPAELLWVASKKWGALNGSLLNFSYGYGKVYIVPHEEVNGQMQGGMCAFDLPQFPTGVMRGRFHPEDGQLYCCGMFAWSSSQQQPGGFYRIRKTDMPANLPISLVSREGRLVIEFSDPLDADSTSDPSRWSIKTWSLKRTKNYGSDHYDTKLLKVENVKLSNDGRVATLSIPDLAPTWCMEIAYSIKAADGTRIENKIHNTIHELTDVNSN